MSFARSPFHCSLALSCLFAFALTGCGSNPGPAGSGGSSGAAGSGGTGGTGGSGGSGAPATCDIALSPSTSGSDNDAVQTAFIEAKPDSTICFNPGTYKFTAELLLNGTAGVTVRGIGASRDDVVLDFSGQDEGDEAVDVQADRFTLEHLTLIDAPGDGVKVSNSDRPTFRDVKASWRAGSVTTNGAYALYPALCSNVLIEHCEVEGAADAGIYLGQSTTGVVRHNKAHGNVIGIEAENSEDVAIYDNESWDNTCGILVVALPGLTKKITKRTSVHDNIVHDNNRANFGLESAFVSTVPKGSGILIASADETHVYGNTLRGNGSPGILVVSWPTIVALGGPAANDPAFDQYAETAYLHDNMFENNGAAPDAVYTGAPLSLTPPIASIMWDGFTDTMKDANTAPSRKLCLQNNVGATYLNINVPDLTHPLTDVAAHDCVYAPLTPVAFK